MLNPLLKLDTTNNLNYAEYERYSRHMILDEIDKHGQQRIKAAKVLFIGAGGLSSSSLLYLTASGIGTIGIIDHDKVELSNLQRQIIYNIKNIKLNKVQAAKINLEQINPLIEIKTYHKRFTENNAYNIIIDYDIIIDGTDNFISRYTISKYCHKLHKIHIYGAVERFIGEISIFNYQNGPNYYDLYQESSNKKGIDCSERGILNTLSATIGLMQATEAIKIITGIGHIVSGYLLRYNALDFSIKTIRIKPIKTNIATNHLIVYHKNSKNHLFKAIYIKKIHQSYLKNNNYYLIDIRENREFKFSHIKKAVNIPLKKLQNITNIQKIKQEASQKKIIIYCNNELRSYIAAKIFHKNNIDYSILKGGLNKYTAI